MRKTNLWLTLVLFGLMACSNADRTLQSTQASCEMISVSGEAPQSLCYQVIDGQKIFQGDIVLGSASRVGALISNQGYLSQTLWNGGVVPYEFEADFPNQQRVLDAAKEYATRTAIRWIPRTTETDYVTFRRKPGAACWANIGRIGGQQFVDLDDACYTPQVIHEMGHVLGLWHEQTRGDRDQHITIRWENVTTGFESAFQQNPNYTQDFGPYDYSSIMHYDSKAFSKNGEPTITRTDGSTNVGNASKLSYGDLAALASAYGGTLPPSGTLNLESAQHAVAAAPASGSGTVRVWNADTGTFAGSVDPFPGFAGGITVALGDFDADGVLDVIAGAGKGGGPRVIVFSGKDGSILKDFFPYEASFRGGVAVASNDVNADGVADIVTGTGSGGGPRVTVWSGRGGTLADFFAYESSFRGGVQVAAGDYDGNGRADIITGAGAGGGPRVKVFTAAQKVLTDFYAYESSFRGGVNVGAYDLNGDGRAEILTGTGSGGAPRVIARSGGTRIADFYAGDAGTRFGVNVAGTHWGGQAVIAAGYGANGTTGVRLYSLQGNLIGQLETDSGTGANVAGR